MFLSQLADVPLGWQQFRWAAQRAGVPAEAELRGSVLQPVQPRSPGAGAFDLHGEAVHGRQQPRNTRPAELQTAPSQTHRFKVQQCTHMFTNMNLLIMIYDWGCIMNLWHVTNEHHVKSSDIHVFQSNTCTQWPVIALMMETLGRSQIVISQPDSMESGNHLPASGVFALCGKAQSCGDLQYSPVNTWLLLTLLKRGQ